jgi:hypothetical protein
MRITVSVVLFLFLSFIAMPTIMGCFNDDSDMSLVFSMSEEEESHKNISIKEALKSTKLVISFQFIPKKNKNLIFKNQVQYDSILDEIFSPPPEI